MANGVDISTNGFNAVEAKSYLKVFVQECLKRFGEPGDQFVLTYRDKDEKETAADENKATAQEELVQQFKEYRNPFSSMIRAMTIQILLKACVRK